MIGIIFSRDRAFQLEANLRSFLLHCQDHERINLNILFLATNLIHARQYGELEQEFTRKLSLRFIPQSKFRSDLLKLLLPAYESNHLMNLRRQIIDLGPHFGFLNGFGLAKAPIEYVLFMVDDNLFVKDFCLQNIESALDANSNALGFSLRLGLNTTYCYAKNAVQPLPSFIQVNEAFLKYDWTRGELDFGYPLEVSSSIYRSTQIWKMLNEVSFNNPNTLESRMATNKLQFKQTYPYLLCPEQSVTFCNPINKVQTVWDNRSGINPRYSVENLAELFNNGYHIQVESYSGFTPNACHQEVSLAIEKRQGDPS
jgi:hypothetical protein